MTRPDFRRKFQKILESFYKKPAEKLEVRSFYKARSSEFFYEEKKVRSLEGSTVYLLARVLFMYPWYQLLYHYQPREPYRRK